MDRQEYFTIKFAEDNSGGFSTPVPCYDLNKNTLSSCPELPAGFIIWNDSESADVYMSDYGNG